MDFLDPKKQRMHKIQLLVGYVLIAIALGIATRILLYQTHGYDIDKNGKVIQNGFVFLSTQPGGAKIYLNGILQGSQTSARLQLPAGQYSVKLERDGYRTWTRTVTVAGDDLQHFDYPFLFPVQLAPVELKQYGAPPNLVSQSPDRHWAVVQASANFTSFDVYDLTNPKVAPVANELPKAVLTDSDGPQSWQLVAWANDNIHVLLKHLYQKSGQAASEYILLDRADETQSLNLTKTLGTNPDEIELRNQAYDQYWLYSQSQQTVSTASLKDITPVLYVDHVLDFTPYATNMMLYATADPSMPSQVAIKLRQGQDTFAIRDVTAGAPYLMDTAQYNGDWYVIAGSSAENKVYIYKNPVAEVQDEANKNVLPPPIRVLSLQHPTYAKFSMNTQYIMAESGTTFGVYDVFNEHQYSYTIKSSMDTLQTHAVWMDGARMQYVSGGKLLVFDYDGTNQQTLEAASSGYEPFFDRDYKFSYSLVAVPVAASATKPATTVYQLDDTPLRIPQGQ